MSETRTDMDALPAALDGLSRIEVSDCEVFDAAVAASGATGWTYYFPYLHFFSQLSGGERVLFERTANAVLVYRLVQKRDRPTLSLLVPPFPFDHDALDIAGARMAEVNRDGRQRISRVPEELAWAVARAGFELRFNDDEYIYDAAQVREMEGRDYASLRRKIGRFDRDAMDIRPYGAAERAGCEALLEGWRRTLTERGIRIGPYKTYAQRCLANDGAFHSSRLRGEVIEIDGAIAAFTFGGPIDAESASLFITVSDHRQPGLAYLQRHRFMAHDPGPRLFNDFVDSGRAGLAQMKRTFRPVRMHTLLSARRS